MNGLVVRVGTESYRFEPDVTVKIGRSPDSDVVIANSNVSRNHAVIANEAGTWVIRDMGSLQGTWRDGQRIEALELRGTVHVTLGLEDRGMPMVLEAPTGGGNDRVRPGGSMAESELDSSTEVVGHGSGPRGRMDETVVVDDEVDDLVRARSGDAVGAVDDVDPIGPIGGAPEYGADVVQPGPEAPRPVIPDPVGGSPAASQRVVIWVLIVLGVGVVAFVALVVLVAVIVLGRS